MMELGNLPLPGIMDIESVLENPDELKKVRTILQRVQAQLGNRESEIGDFIIRALNAIDSGKINLHRDDKRHIERLRILISILGNKQSGSYTREDRPDGFSGIEVGEIWKDIKILGDGDNSCNGFLVQGVLNHYIDENSVESEQRASKKAIRNLISPNRG